MRWLYAHGAAVTEVDVSDPDGFEEIVRRISPKVRARLVGAMSPAERRAGLEPRERLEGLGLRERLEGLGLRERLEGLEPRERLEGLGLRERLEGLSPDQILLALPDALLAQFRPEFLEGLPEPVRAEVRRRLAAR